VPRVEGVKLAAGGRVFPRTKPVPWIMLAVGGFPFDGGSVAPMVTMKLRRTFLPWWVTGVYLACAAVMALSSCRKTPQYWLVPGLEPAKVEVTEAAESL
jgi:hypothetical protein